MKTNALLQHWPNPEQMCAVWPADEGGATATALLAATRDQTAGLQQPGIQSLPGLQRGCAIVHVGLTPWRPSKVQRHCSAGNWELEQVTWEWVAQLTTTPSKLCAWDTGHFSIPAN